MSNQSIDFIYDTLVGDTNLSKEQILCAMPGSAGYMGIYVIKNNSIKPIGDFYYDRFARCEGISNALARALLGQLLKYAIAYYKGTSATYPPSLEGNVRGLKDPGYKEICQKYQYY